MHAAKFHFDTCHRIHPCFLTKVNRERVRVADMMSFHGVDETPDIPFLLETVKLPAA
jgi:hypothetical protein